MTLSAGLRWAACDVEPSSTPRCLRDRRLVCSASGMARSRGCAPRSGKLVAMANAPRLRKLDAITVRVPDLDNGLRFYRDALRHRLKWRNDDAGQAGLWMPESDTEIVSATRRLVALPRRGWCRGSESN